MRKTNTPQTQATATWDIVVVGGGPAGMMAAATAATRGAKVLLLEKNGHLGKKLSITGGGRCNVTNNKQHVRDLVTAYATDGKFLFSTFTQHGVAESIAWFLERGVSFIEENEGRLFPATESAETIRETLITEMKARGVTVQSNQAVCAVAHEATTKTFLITTAQTTVSAKACILATGGYARPDTGSTGDGFRWLEKLGHEVHAPSSALVPLALKTTWTRTLSGLTLPTVTVNVWAGKKKRATASGRILFTHFGVSGPLILNMSTVVGNLLKEGPVELRLNLFPQHDARALKETLQGLLVSNKLLHNVLADVLPRQLVHAILSTLAIDGTTPSHSVSKESRNRLLQYCQAVPLPVSHLLGADKAIVSSGGVALTEVNFKTMSSRLIPELYLVGDLLNINRPSGGYSLQLCWSTGYVAGYHAAACQKAKNSDASETHSI